MCLFRCHVGRTLLFCGLWKVIIRRDVGFVSKVSCNDSNAPKTSWGRHISQTVTSSYIMEGGVQGSFKVPG